MWPRPLAPPVSVPLQDGFRFPPPYPHRHGSALRLSYRPSRSATGFPRSPRLTRLGEVLSISPVACVSMPGKWTISVPCYGALVGSSLSASLACCLSRRLSRVHLCSPSPPSWSPLRLMLADTPFPHGSGASRVTVGAVVRGLWTARSLAAVPRRILLMEQQVWSVQHARQSTLRPRVADPLKAGHLYTTMVSSL